MDLYLQFGYGMMGMSEELIGKWNEGTVILSPRDLSFDQMKRTASLIRSQGGKIVIDPQFYIPRSEHNRLNSHEFWPEDYQTQLFNRSAISQMLKVLKSDYNDKFNSDFFIIPGIYSSEINDDWYHLNSIIIDEVSKLDLNIPRFATICLSSEVVLSEELIHLTLEYLEDWDIEGVYIVAEPPNNSYLVEDPIWLLNLLDLVSGIKLQRKKVVVGYANHQLLCLALAKVDAIASGNWLNVRSFNTDRFNAPVESASRRSKWYYCPQALSEYQMPMLDIAFRLGIIDQLATNSSFNSPSSASLFSGSQPSSTGFGEGDSFRHYLQCLRLQTLRSVKSTYAETKQSVRLQFETAEMLTEFLQNNGVRGRKRDFSNVVEYTQSALIAFDKLRGLRLENRWSSL